MSEHTPGPWWFEVGTSEDSWAKQWPTIQSESREVVGTEGMYGDIDEDIANARLIAAAPDLLEALKGLLNNSCRADWPADLYDAATDAIAKATGEKK